MIWSFQVLLIMFLRYVGLKWFRRGCMESGEITSRRLLEKQRKL